MLGILASGDPPYELQGDEDRRQGLVKRPGRQQQVVAKAYLRNAQLEAYGNGGDTGDGFLPERRSRFVAFDEKIIALYARGISVRDIQARLGELFGVELGRDLISRVTDTAVEDVRAWQQRPLEDV